MPPSLALAMTIVFIFYLLRRDAVLDCKPSSALWIPSVWMLILGSRSVAQWLNLGAPFQSADDLLEGSPIDRAVFLLLMLAGLVVLVRRRIVWSNEPTPGRINLVAFDNSPGRAAISRNTWASPRKRSPGGRTMPPRSAPRPTGCFA